MYIRVLVNGAGVIQICWIAPDPLISANVNVDLALIGIEGETFQPCPKSRATCLPLPSVAIPAFPFSPVKFSGLMDRVSASDNR